MAKKRTTKTKKTRIYLTERALRDIVGIEEYSVREFGQKVASRYVAKLEAAIARIAENPELFRAEPEMHSWLRFYRAEKHLMIADFNDGEHIIVLTLIHASKDIPSQLSELEPTLMAETELMHRQLRDGK